MSELRDVLSVGDLSGMSVLSLATGNMLGQVRDILVDPISGVLLGVVVLSSEGEETALPLDEIYSVGRDAIMARNELSLGPVEDSKILGDGRPANNLVGTKIITEGGNVLGQITDVFVTLSQPPHILYEARQSLLDKLLGRTFFIPASVGNALSDDCARLVVPDVTSEIATSDLESLLEQQIEVRTFNAGVRTRPMDESDRTILIDDDETLVRVDEDETVVRIADDEDTVVRSPRRVIES